jgi:very-short-patch-repair endonuclease
VHDEIAVQAYDEERQQAIESLNIRVLRFRNDEVLHHVDSVLMRIRQAFVR